jgi:hypothetical protein
MMGWRVFVAGAAAFALFGCGQPQQQQSGGETGAPPLEEEIVAEEAPADLPPVDPDPSEIGVFAAPTVMAALEPVIGPEAHQEGSTLALTVRQEGDAAVADIVRYGMADDSVSAGHLRVEFRREPEGWYPTNAYRRSQCARGGLAGQWTAELCP